MIKELKDAIKDQELVYGTKSTIRGLKDGKAKVVFIASNCPEEVREEIKRYAGLSEAKVFELDIPDSEVGMLCKRRYSVSVLSY